MRVEYGDAMKGAMSPTTRSPKKTSSKDKIKSLSESSLKKSLNALVEKQLQGEKANSKAVLQILKIV